MEGGEGRERGEMRGERGGRKWSPHLSERGCAPAKTKQEMDQMTSYRLKHGHLKLFQVPDRSITNILYATLETIAREWSKNLHRGGFSPSLGMTASLLHSKIAPKVLSSNACAYLRPKFITPVSPKQVCNKLARAKVRCVCCVLSFYKFHDIGKLATSTVYGEVTDKRV